MKLTLRIVITAVAILVISVTLLLLLVFPAEHLAINPNFPEISGPYLGQKPPGLAAERFAPGLIDDEVHTAAVFSPDGREVYWSYMALEPNEIVYMSVTNGIWRHPQVVSFASRFFDSDDPCFSPDGKRLFFTSWRPVRWTQIFNLTEGIWYVERTEQGWSTPQAVGKAINSMNLHWQFSVAKNGSLYFSSEGDIYRSVYMNEHYQQPIKLGNQINTPSNEGHPFIAPDESYLLFSSHKQKDSLGDYDLYFSIQDDDGSWSKTINLGDKVNSKHQELYPVVSPDEKYLFFISNRDGMHNIYWVDFESIKMRIAASYD